MSDLKEAPLERELKFPCDELGALRERLLALEAERLAPSNFEDNLVLDREGELLGRGCLLRLRNDAHGARLTFKGPARFEGDVRVREEYETGADDLDAVQSILRQLGFVVATRYQKYREEWRVGGVLVALDHTPVGDFVEFEGGGAPQLAKRCGFDPKKSERRSYLEIYRDHREEHPDAPTDMVFP